MADETKVPATPLVPAPASRVKEATAAAKQEAKDQKAEDAKDEKRDEQAEEAEAVGAFAPETVRMPLDFLPEHLHVGDVGSSGREVRIVTRSPDEVEVPSELLKKDEVSSKKDKAAVAARSNAKPKAPARKRA